METFGRGQSQTVGVRGGFGTCKRSLECGSGRFRETEWTSAESEPARLRLTRDWDLLVLAVGVGSARETERVNP
jgi:hypothetical protein